MSGFRVIEDKPDVVTQLLHCPFKLSHTFLKLLALPLLPLVQGFNGNVGIPFLVVFFHILHCLVTEEQLPALRSLAILLHIVKDVIEHLLTNILLHVCIGP